MSVAPTNTISLPRFPQEDKSAALHSGNCESDVVRKIVLQMRKLENCDVTLNEWADYSNQGKFELIAQFKRHTGITPMAFHKAEKLEICKRLMVIENMSVTDVCFEVGFESIGSFVASFSKNVGMPPGAYSKQMRSIRLATMFFSILRRLELFERKSSRSAEFLIEHGEAAAGLGFIAAIFQQPYPSSRPVDWCYLPPFRSVARLKPEEGCYCLVASLSGFRSLVDFVNFRPHYVGRTYLSGRHKEFQVALRPRSDLDPPVTLAVPVLLCLEGQTQIDL